VTSPSSATGWGSATARVLLAVVAVLALTGCDTAQITPPPVETRVDVDTPALRTLKEQARIAPCPTPGGTSDLPAQELACLGGGRAVDLSALAGPAVVPLWASWCVRCRKELPIYQRLFEEAGDRVAVLGVDYQDTQPDEALRMLRKAGARFPVVADPGGVLAETYRVRGLPAVAWVKEDGSVVLDNARIDTWSDLVTLVSDRLGVEVTPAGAG
jgi:thiol-disulfide isomerase/thioredoxin